MDASILLGAVGIAVGLIGLWWSSNKSVEYSIKLSKIFSITTFFIGFVLIAVATGLPELAITITSLWHNVPGVAVGTIVGSNLIDVSLVLGLPAVILGTLNVKQEDKLPLMLMLIVTALVMAFVFILGSLNHIHGLLLLILYVASIWWLWKTKATRIIAKEEAIEELSGKNRIKTRPILFKLLIFVKLLVSIALVIVFSKLSIDATIFFVSFLPFRLEVFGATVFAIGTSLPELALSFQAVRKKEYSLAFGNSFGSVLEQATLILGILALGSQKRLDITILRPIAPIMFLSYAVVAHSLLKKTKVGRREGLNRKEGLLLLGLFAAHMIYYLAFKRG